MFHGLTGNFLYLALGIGAGVVTLAAVIYVAIFVALAMDRGQTAPQREIDWDDMERYRPCGKTRHR